MWSKNASYKERPFLEKGLPRSLPLSPPLHPHQSPSTISTFKVNTADGFSFPSARQPHTLLRHHHPFSTPTQTQASSSCPTSTPSTPLTPSFRPVELKLPDIINHELLTPPPTSSRGKERKPSPLLYRHPPSIASRTLSSKPIFLYRSEFWPESPTLSTRRARKHSKPLPTLALPYFSGHRSSRELASHAMSSAPSSSPRESFQCEKRVTRTHTQTLSRSGAQAQDVNRMLPPLKPRALTLDGLDGPSLPPMHSLDPQSHIGPIRTSSRSFSNARHSGEYRSNPSYVFTPGRKSTDSARRFLTLSPEDMRDTNELDVWTPSSQ